jgi:16S rRNA (adenine1518-N6/adenine1519-N6)-dimethyltransferase
MDKKQIKNLFKEHHLKPNKYLGQNFLISQNTLNKIIKAAHLSPQDTVLEVGPGLGVLTESISLKAKKIISIEKDKNMVKMLQEILKNQQNVKIIQEDILKTEIKKLKIKKYKIIANIPYYLTSPFIRKFLESTMPPQEMILLMQKEVAKRICAFPPKMSLLAVSVQLYAQPKIISAVSRKSFWPQPKVDSAIIKITNIKKPQNIIIEDFFKIVKAGFSHPRKQLINNLSSNFIAEREEIKNILDKLEISQSVRAESLSLQNWQDIYCQLK